MYVVINKTTARTKTTTTAAAVLRNIETIKNARTFYEEKR